MEMNCCHTEDQNADALVQQFGTVVDGGLRSPSSVFDGMSDSDGGVAICDPLSMLRGMLACGVPVDQATGLIASYYGAFKDARSVPSEVSKVSSRHTSASKMSRLRRWTEEVSVMPQRPGQCYLSVVRWGRRKAYSQALGDSPQMRDFIAMLEPGDLDVSTARACSLYRLDIGQVGNVLYHVAESCDDGIRLGSVYECIACVLREYPFVNTRGYICDSDLTVEVMPLVGRVGAMPADVGFNVSQSQSVVGRVLPPVVSDLSDLQTADFTQCKCMIHRVPTTADQSFASFGCCKRSAGQAGVIRNSFDGVRAMCHATEVVRSQDNKLLQLMLSDDDPNVLDGRRRSPEIARLCTSSLNTNIQSFGNGYCYLNLIAHDAWWRVARVLGPNPRVAAVMRAMVWVGRPRSKLQKITVVRDGYYHVSADNQSKGVCTSAGVKHYELLAEICRHCPDARIGGTADELLLKWDKFVTPAFATLIACVSILVAMFCMMIKLLFMRHWYV